MKIVYLSSWPIPYQETELSNIVGTQFGYYTLKQKGVDITWHSHNRNGTFYKFCKKLRMPQVNQIFGQISILKVARNYDVIYVAFDMHLLPLAILKLLGLIKTPIFVLSHFSYNTRYTNSKWKKAYKRFERILVYSAFEKISFACPTLLNIAKEDYPVPEKHWNYANWGSNLRFYNLSLFREKPLNKYFVAAGGMNRDYATLIEAFRKMGSEKPGIKIFSKYRDYTKGNSLPDNVSFVNLMTGCKVIDAFKQLRYHYYNSIAILLPIDYLNDVPNGATVLVEALAMGKPIVITEADINYIDVEKEGVGLTVKRHNIDDWVRALNYLIDNPDKVKEMGEKAFLLAKTIYNDELFASNVWMQMNSISKNL